jgi:alanine racemase
MVVNLAAIRQNFNTLKKLSNTAECAAVVKGDGYGHGMLESARVLLTAGARTFFVATAEDATGLRSALQNETIAVLGGYVPSVRSEFEHHNLVPVLNSLEQIKGWSEVSTSNGIRKRAILHIDTGMNRLGLRDGQISLLAQDARLLNSIDWVAVMTHFSAADDLDFERCEIQRQKFLAGCKLLPIVRRSMANSAASHFGNDFLADLYRPGKSTFGINPLTGVSNPMREPASVFAPLLQIETVSRGAAIGYSSTFRSACKSRIATVGIGYANGYPRSASNCGIMAIDGFRAPVVGRVSMDVTTIDVTEIPLELLVLGSNVEVLGPTVTAEEIAKRCSTIEHEILIGLGRGCRRIYVDENYAD